MKKILAVALALIMLFALLAGCNKDTPANDSPGSAAPGQSGAQNDPAPASSAPPAQSPVNTEDAPRASEQDRGAGSVGFYTDDTDWFGRPAYKFAYISNNWFFIHELVAENFERWGKLMNYEFTVTNSGGDMTAFFAAVETYANMGYDGLLLDPDPVFTYRTLEVMEELGIPYLPVIVPMRDPDTRDWLAPGVDLDGYNMVSVMTQWFCDNYRTKWPNVEPEEIGYLFMLTTTNLNFVINMTGGKDTWARNYPDLTDHFFEGDMLGYDANAQGAFEYSSTFVTSHPEIKYWFISAAFEDLTQGAVRMAEDLNIEDNVIVLSNGTSWLVQEWENGYEGDVWLGGTWYAYALFAEAYAAGLIALIEGRATFETLWGSEFIPEGQKYPVYLTPVIYITKDTYVQVLAELDAYMS